jgi:hypothetical protein
MKKEGSWGDTPQAPAFKILFQDRCRAYCEIIIQKGVNFVVRYIAEDSDHEFTLLEPAPAAYLVLVVEGRVSHSFPLRGQVEMGRDRTNAIVVADHKVSRHHASLAQIDNTYIITDQGSANGTYVNGVLIAQPTRLQENDHLTLGDTHFLFTHKQPEPQAISLPVAPVPAAGPAFSSSSGLPQNAQPIWVTVGCMALIIVALLVVVALLLGVFVGRSQFFGLVAVLFWPGG